MRDSLALVLSFGFASDGISVREGVTFGCNFWKRAALQTHMIYCIKCHSWALEGVLEDLAGAKVVAKACVGEVNGDSGARNKPERKQG